MMRSPRIIVIIIAFLGSLIGFSGQSAAHAVLVETMPARDSILAMAPAVIELRFNEPVTPIALRIIGRGESRALAAVIRDGLIAAAAPGDLASGSYLVSYRVTSADSHPVSGAFLFTVGAPSSEAPAVPDLRQRDETWSLLVALNRMVLLAGLAFAAGGALFAAVVLRPGHPLLPALRRPLRIGAVIALASALLAVPLQGGLLTAAPLSDLASWFDDEIFRIGWHSNLGASAALICLGLAAVALGAAGRQTRWIIVSAAGAILAAGALAASGHAATTSPRWLALSAMACHAVAMGFWAGSLWPLLRALTLPRGEATHIVRRFSRWAVGALIVLIAAGLVLAILQLGGDITAFVTTAYGQLLLLKLALVALILFLAAHNKWRLTPALARGDKGTAERLAGAIRLEIAAIGLILAVTALLGQTPPPRAIALADRSAAGFHGDHGIALPRSVTAEKNGMIAVATLSPAHSGRNTLAVTLRRTDGVPLAALEARAEISLPSAGVDALPLPLRPVSPSRYETTTDALVIAGIWQLRLIVLLNEFEQMEFDLTLPVR